MDSKRTILKNGSMIGCGDVLKKSQSELALEELFASDDQDHVHHDDKINHKDDIYGASDHHPHNIDAVLDHNSHHMHFPYKNSEVVSEFSLFPSENLYPHQPKVPATTGSQSSISVNSLIWDNNVNNQDVSGSSHEQSDEEDLEIEAGSSEQTTNAIDTKRFKRKISNRESARRSRRRKQAYLTDLEHQVEQLRGENESLFKELTHASQQFKDAATNHRVLKSDVEALRAKVKLAEDLVARGSLTSSLSHLIQNYLNTPEDYMNNNTNHMNNVSPLIYGRADDNSPTSCVTDSSINIGLENVETFDNNAITNAATQIPEVWTSWESHVSK